MDNMSSKITDEVQWPTTEVTLTPEEEGTIVTVVVVVVAILAVIIFLFSMGIFIDCQTQLNDLINRNTISSSGKRKRMRLKMPPLGRAQRQHHRSLRREDSKYLATDMCPNGSSVQPANLDVAVV